jgi:hypothetical protein
VAAAREGLDAARAELEGLRARGGRIEEEKRPEFDRTVSDLEAQLEAVDERIERLGEAGADAWGKLADEVRAGLTKLGESISAALSRFGEP